ncbi:MAG: FHA domain-containing protein [Pseudomonadota bacterium]
MITVVNTDKKTNRTNRRFDGSEPLEANTDTVVLTVDGALFQFHSVDEFSTAVEGRTAISSALFTQISKLNHHELHVLASTLKEEEKTLIDVLERTLSAPGTLTAAINRIPLSVLRNDHCWRDIIVSLCDLDADEEYLQTAVVKYLQFLSSHQEVVRLLHAITSEETTIPASQEDIEADVAPYETALFDVLQYSDAGRMVNPYRRLPQGEAVTLHALPGHPINLLLAKYSFELVNRNGWKLLDAKNREYALANDLNYIGRGRENDVALSNEYRNVSRKHVIVHPLDDSSVVLIDLSSHGTFVPPRQVDLSSAN